VQAERAVSSTPARKLANTTGIGLGTKGVLTLDEESDLSDFIKEGGEVECGVTREELKRQFS